MADAEDDTPPIGPTADQIKTITESVLAAEDPMAELRSRTVNRATMTGYLRGVLMVVAAAARTVLPELISGSAAEQIRVLTAEQDNLRAQVIELTAARTKAEKDAQMYKEGSKQWEEEAEEYFDKCDVLQTTVRSRENEIVRLQSSLAHDMVCRESAPQNDTDKLAKLLERMVAVQEQGRGGSTRSPASMNNPSFPAEVHFDATDADPDDFLVEFEAHVSACDKRFWLHHLGLRLAPAIRKNLTQHQKTNKVTFDYGAAVQWLRDTYTKRDSDTRLYQRVLALAQGTRSVRNYILDFDNLHARLANRGKPESSFSQRERFIAGLQQDIAIKLKSDPNFPTWDLQSIKDRSVAFDEATADTRTYGGKGNVSAAGLPDTADLEDGSAKRSKSADAETHVAAAQSVMDRLTAQLPFHLQENARYERDALVASIRGQDTSGGGRGGFNTYSRGGFRGGFRGRGGGRGGRSRGGFRGGGRRPPSDPAYGLLAQRCHYSDTDWASRMQIQFDKRSCTDAPHLFAKDSAYGQPACLRCKVQGHTLGNCPNAFDPSTRAQFRAAHGYGQAAGQSVAGAAAQAAQMIPFSGASGVQGVPPGFALVPLQQPAPQLQPQPQAHGAFQLQAAEPAEIQFGSFGQ